MPRIRSLKPRVPREQAVEEFSSSGFTRWAGNFWHGHLRNIAEFYIPLRLFRVEVHHTEGSEQWILGLDAVKGTLDLYPFDQVPSSSEIISVDTRNCAPALLTDEQATQLLLQKVRRIIRAQGFLRTRKMHIQAEPIPGDIYVPYWVGFRGRSAAPYLTVMDAAQGQIQGSQVRRLLQAWLLSAA
jgi:hypothetical protein